MAFRALLILSAALVFTKCSVRASKSKHFLSNSLIESVNDVVEENYAIGGGAQAGEAKVASIRAVLQPMWRTLPKTDVSGHIDRRSLRYLVHRYFMQTSSLQIRGFEPTQPVNESHWGVADILSSMVPAYVESVLEGQHAKKSGFSLKDVVNMVTMLEQLIFETQHSLLERIYTIDSRSTQLSISHMDLKEILKAYLIAWMLGGGDDGASEALGANRSFAQEIMETIPHFQGMVEFAEGRIKALHFSRLQQIPKGRARDTWDVMYSFEDASAIVGDISTNFQSFWQSECEDIKDALMSLDMHYTGRVPLSKFYHPDNNTDDSRFGESESYLRELGALDESASKAGPQVIISNYVQAASNCIISTPYYRVCCHNECEPILGVIEAALQSSTALPKDILAVVGNITLEQSDLDVEESPDLEGPLTQQLEQIASSQRGVVPLHGRLFAQWLHYVFPSACPFPHKIGMTTAVAPVDYGEDYYLVSESERRKHAANMEIPQEDLHWMSQWDPEEEFRVDYSPEFDMTWNTRMLLAVGGFVLLAFGIMGGVTGCSVKTPVNAKKCWI